jgi:hypothetical protein
LKKVHESLETCLKVRLPSFPSTSWFFPVNGDTKRIEKRMSELDSYLKSLTAIREVRECFLFKNFLKDARLVRD